MRRRWLAVGVVAAAISMIAGGAYAASTSVSMNAGDSMNVSCPNALSNSGVSANAETVNCAPNLPPPPPPPPAGNCGIASPAFCETFDQPTSNGPANSRAGQLNGVLWGTGMATGNQPGNMLSVNYPNNMQIVNGQLADTVTDGGTVTSLAMYPRQPFDFAGRTGTITFDVNSDSQGNHAAWPELWVTDQPVPVPFTHEASWISQPRNGFGIRFAGCTDSNGNAGGCNFPTQVGVDSAIVVNNYQENDSFNGGNLRVVGDQYVNESGPGQTNHYQIAVSATQIDVYGTDAFTPGQTVPPLKHISTISNFGTLGFSRGLVWLEDAHYNANKFGTQGTHTFTWDNLGFDGPVLPRDLGFDVPAGDYQAPTTVTVPGLTNVNQGTGALLVFNFYSFSAGFPLQVAVNGQDVSIPWPFPDSLSYSTRTIAVPVPLADLVAGNNIVSFPENGFLFQVFNIDLILQGAGG